MLLGAVLGGLGNGAPTPAQIWTATDIRRNAARLAGPAEAKGLEGMTLGAYGSQSAAIWRRAKSGEAELHRTRTDLLVVEEGSATLVYGGAIQNPRASAPDEIRGPSISGGESRRVAPGDVIRIPPGVPHQFVLAKGESIAYFAFKTAR